MHANIVTHTVDAGTFEITTPFLSHRAGRFLPLTCGKVTLTQGDRATCVGMTPDRVVISLRKPGLPDSPIYLPSEFRNDLRSAVKQLKTMRPR